MGIKQGHSLSSIEEIPPEITEHLRELSISTAEELVGQQMADPAGLATFLGVSTDDMTRWTEAAASHMDPEFAEAIRTYTPVERAYGSRPPTTDEFDELRDGGTHEK